MPNFFTNNDDVYAENLNGAALFFIGMGANIRVHLPSDLPSALFAAGINKAGVMMCNIIPDSNVSYYSGAWHINTGTTGAVIFRVYPNIMPFRGWKSINWDLSLNGGSVTVDILRNNGVDLVQSNINSGIDLSGLGLGLENVDFRFNLIKGTSTPNINNIDIEFEGGL